MNRSSRLILSGDFKAVLTRGKRFSCADFNLYWSSGAKLRVGIMVSKKVSKLAVDRNKLKRRIRDIFSKNVPPSLPFSFVVVLKPAAKETDYQTLKSALLQKVKLIGSGSIASSDNKVARSNK